VNRKLIKNRVAFSVLLILFLFWDNSLYSFNPEPTSVPEESEKRSYLGLSLSNNFAYRSDYPVYCAFEEISKIDPVSFTPNISLGLHFEKNLDWNKEKSSSLKFKLLLIEYFHLLFSTVTSLFSKL